MTRPTVPSPPGRRRPGGRALPGLVAAVLAVLATTSLPATPATASQGGWANISLRASPTVLPADRASTVTATGTDYLVPPHAEGQEVFGGVYLFFGWVSDPVAFGPSYGGRTGVTYAYPDIPGDPHGPTQTDPGTGTMRLVSFTAEGESAAGTDYHMDGVGNWSAPLTVKGSSFTYTFTLGNGSKEVRSIDCLALTVGQCGLFTIGAHGKVSAVNERFTRVTFAAPTPQPSVVPPPVAPTSPPPTSSSGAGGGASLSNLPPAAGPSSAPSGTGDTTSTSVPAADGAAVEPDAGSTGPEAEVLAAADAPAEGGGEGGTLAAAGVAGLVVLTGGGLLLWRRRRRAAGV